MADVTLIRVGHRPAVITLMVTKLGQRFELRRGDALPPLPAPVAEDLRADPSLALELVPSTDPAAVEAVLEAAAARGDDAGDEGDGGAVPADGE